MASEREECLKYKAQIINILESSDLSTVTAKSIRRELEAKNQVSLNPIKSEINDFIMELYTAVEEKKEAQEKMILKATPEATPKKVTKKDVKKVEKKTTVTKTVAKKAAKVVEEKEKKPRNWPAILIKAPLSTIIKTDICTRPQVVKKLWEYIRQNNLQDPNDKRMIVCDDNLKAVCDGEERMSGFTINKYLQKYYEKVPEAEQEALNQRYKEKMLAEETNGVQVKEQAYI